jgi:Zn-dependent protease
VFPILGFITGFPLLGWAKPVQTNPLRWREKTKANISVSAAGPISNFILAAIAFIIIKALIIGGVMFPIGGFFTMIVPVGAVFSDAAQPGYLEPLAKFLSVMLMLNVALGVFNLIPVPPLDGSHVLEELLPPAMAGAYEQIRPYGFILLYALLLLGVFSAIFIPVSRLINILVGARFA